MITTTESIDLSKCSLETLRDIYGATNGIVYMSDPADRLIAVLKRTQQIGRIKFPNYAGPIANIEWGNRVDREQGIQ